MPKLRKHSERQQQTPTHDHQESKLSGEKENNSLSNTFDNGIPNITGKLKYKDRLQRIKQYEKHSQNEQNQPDLNAISQTLNPNSNDDIAKYLNTLPDDDLTQTPNYPIPCEKPKKPKLKKGNKFFINDQLQNDSLQQKQQLQENQIIVERKTHNGGEHLMQKIKSKALTVINRLSFKDQNKDYKYKNNMKDKLKSLDSFEEAEILVQVPKIFGGRKTHVEAAIFLKNNRDSGQNRMGNINNSQGEESKQQNSLPKDRKTYYEDMQKQIYSRHIESMTESAMKACFKKSYLDETDFIQDLQQKRTKQREQIGDYERYSEVSNETISKPITVDKPCHLQSQQEGKQKIQQVEVKEEEESNISCHQTQLQTIVQIQQKNNEKETTINQKQPAKKVQAKPKKIKPKKTKKRKGGFNVLEYIQVQAQDSISQNGQRQKQQSQTDGEDDSNMSSFIGEQVPYNEQDELQAHKKYVSDTILQEQKRFQKMRLKMEKQYLEEQKRIEALKERMRLAKAAKQKKQSEQDYTKNVKQTQPQPESESSTAKKKNLDKLQRIGIELGLTTQQSEQNKSTQQQPFNRVKQLENCVLNPPFCMGKLKRQGLKCINLKRNGDKDDGKGCKK